MKNYVRYVSSKTEMINRIKYEFKQYFWIFSKLYEQNFWFLFIKIRANLYKWHNRFFAQYRETLDVFKPNIEFFKKIRNHSDAQKVSFCVFEYQNVKSLYV